MLLFIQQNLVELKVFDVNVVHDVNRASAKRYYDRFSSDEGSKAACNTSSRMKIGENNLKQCKIYGSFILQILVSSDPDEILWSKIAKLPTVERR